MQEYVNVNYRLVMSIVGVVEVAPAPKKSLPRRVMPG